MMAYSPATEFTLALSAKLYASPTRGFSLNEREQMQDSLWLPMRYEHQVGEVTYVRQDISTLMLAEARNKPEIFQYAADHAVHQMHSFMAEAKVLGRLSTAVAREMAIAEAQVHAWCKKKNAR